MCAGARPVTFRESGRVPQAEVFDGDRHRSIHLRLQRELEFEARRLSRSSNRVSYARDTPSAQESGDLTLSGLQARPTQVT